MRRFSPLLVLAMLTGLAALARAQLTGPILPLSTTMVLEKPATDVGYGHQNTIEIGVKDQGYKFILRDAYVDDPSGKFLWGDIWRSVSQFRPNFLARGVGSDEFAKIKPGDTVTVVGMYSMSTRTFEVVSVSPGGGAFAPKQAY
jgi:hypothetical protein